MLESERQTSASKVKLSVHTKPDVPSAEMPFVIKITLQMEDGWHINSATPSNPHAIPTQLDVHSENSNVEILFIDYPAPVSYDGHAVYKHRISIPVTAKIAPGHLRANMRVRVRIQACKDTLCLEPSDIVLRFPIICEA